MSRQPFRFLVGAPLYLFSDQLRPLAAPASIARDSLFLPLQFVAEIAALLSRRALSLGCARPRG